VASDTILALIYSMAYIEDSSEHRLGKHGYPVGTGREMRARRSRRAADHEYYNATYWSGA
jgi:hypothetical protein